MAAIQDLVHCAALRPTKETETLDVCIGFIWAITPGDFRLWDSKQEPPFDSIVMMLMGNHWNKPYSEYLTKVKQPFGKLVLAQG